MSVRHRWQDAVAGILFVGVLMTPGVVQVANHSTSYVVTELTDPPVLPGMPVDLRGLKEWPGRMDLYLNSHFGLRSVLVYWNSRIRLWFGESGSRDVAVGRNRWLFLSRSGQERDKFCGVVRFDTILLDRWMAEMRRRSGWLRRRGSELMLVIVPNKSSVYSSLTPNSWCRVNTNMTDQLVSALREQGDIRWIDLRSALSPAMAQEGTYRRYDTHWNDKGCHLAYCAIVDDVAARHPVHRVTTNDLVWEPRVVSGDLARLLHLEDSLVEATSMARVGLSAVISPEAMPAFHVFRKNGYSAETSHRDTIRAYVLCDSFVAGSMYKWLQESFARTDFVHHDGLQFPVRDIIRAQPDVVMYICVERLIPLVLPSVDLPEDGSDNSEQRVRGNAERRE